MSTMLEQAIIDAGALREAAIKSAENAIVEKYADEVKGAVQQMLEQDPDDETTGLGDAEQVELDIGSEDEEVKIMADIPSAHDPDAEDDEIVVLDLDQIITAADADAGTEDDEYKMDAAEIADEVGIPLDDDESPANRSDDEINISESDLVDMFQEMLSVDVDPKRVEQVEAMVEEEEEEEKEEEVVTSAAEAGMDAVDVENHQRLERQVESLRKENKKFKNILAKVKDRLEEVNLSNARLLYANRVLQDNSLNEQQKNKIVDMLSETRSVEETEMVYETLQKTLASTQTRRGPKSLSEAVSRKSSVILSGRRKEETTDESPVKNRWATLAGINNK